MKKILFIALLLLGISNVSMFGMVQEIILIEMYSIMPLDDADENKGGRKPDPNLFRASFSNNNLSVGAHTSIPAYVEVIDQETGEVVIEEEFVEETEVTINQVGLYTIQIYSGNTIMTGEFEVE